MASIELALASIDAGHRREADADVLRRLCELGIVSPAAVHLLATSEAGLRSAAAGILGDGFGNHAWFALLRVWQSSAYQGRQWMQQRGRQLAAGPPPPANRLLRPSGGPWFDFPPPLVGAPPPPRGGTSSQAVPVFRSSLAAAASTRTAAT